MGSRELGGKSQRLEEEEDTWLQPWLPTGPLVLILVNRELWSLRFRLRQTKATDWAPWSLRRLFLSR